MPEFIKRPALSFQEEVRAMEDWRSRGLSLCCARALAKLGFLTVEGLNAASGHELPNMRLEGVVSMEWTLLPSSHDFADERARRLRPVKGSTGRTRRP